MENPKPTIPTHFKQRWGGCVTFKKISGHKGTSVQKPPGYSEMPAGKAWLSQKLTVDDSLQQAWSLHSLEH